MPSARRPRDNYYTEDRLTRAICGRLAGLLPAPATIVEPSAGDGAFIKAASATWPAAHLIAVDIDPRCRQDCVRSGAKAFVQGNFLELRTAEGVDLVVGNPPYSAAEEFTKRAISVAPEGGHVAFLLRSGFLHGQQRSRWVLQNLRWQIPLAERPSFTGDGKTDSSEYSIFVWCRGHAWPPLILPHLRWRSAETPTTQKASSQPGLFDVPRGAVR